MSRKEKSEEFALEDPPRWEVITRYKIRKKGDNRPREISYHALVFDGHEEKRERGEQGLERLRDLAKFCNAKKLKPRPAIQCAADAPNPDRYLKDIAP